MTSASHQTGISTLFNDWAESGRDERMAGGHWPRVSQFFDTMALTQGMTVLDAGCGSGYLVSHMAEKVAGDNAYGVDIAPTMIGRAQTRYKDTVPASNFSVAEAETLPFDDNTFDRIVSIEMLYYAEQPQTVVNEWARVIKKEAKPNTEQHTGEIFVMVDYYQENNYSTCWGDLLPVPVHYMTEADYKTLFTNAGAKEVFTSRCLDPRPITDEDKANFTPGWGTDTIDDLKDFRENVGSLLIHAKF